MPIEAKIFRDRPEPLHECPKCKAKPFTSKGFRGQVVSDWRRLFRQPYWCVICDACDKIVGYEIPLTRYEEAIAQRDGLTS